MLAVTDLGSTSPAAASTVAGAALGGDFGLARTFAVAATLAGATGGTLDVYLQDSVDGITWYDYLHFPQLAAGAAAVTYFYNAAMTNSIVTPCGSGTVAAPGVLLAANTARGGHPLNFIRTVMVAGAGTSAGAMQVIKALAQ